MQPAFVTLPRQSLNEKRLALRLRITVRLQGLQPDVSRRRSTPTVAPVSGLSEELHSPKSKHWKKSGSWDESRHGKSPYGTSLNRCAPASESSGATTTPCDTASAGARMRIEKRLIRLSAPLSALILRSSDSSSSERKSWALQTARSFRFLPDLPWQRLAPISWKTTGSIARQHK